MFSVFSAGMIGTLVLVSQADLISSQCTGNVYHWLKYAFILFQCICFFVQPSVTLTCTGCQITSNLALQFPIGGVAQVIQLTIQTPSFATANAELITEMTRTSRNAITN